MTSAAMEHLEHDQTSARAIPGNNGMHGIKQEEDEQSIQQHQQSLLQQQQQHHALQQQQQYLAQATAISQQHHQNSPHLGLSQSMSSMGMGGAGMAMQHQKMSASAAVQQLSHAEKRANHNAIERARRENLNIRFLELAQSIPSLLHVRKPSKSVIVSRAIDFVHETKSRLDVKTRSLQLLRQQNEEFKLEINRLRSKLGMNPVVFADNIDLDLVFEANLEHAREHSVDHPSSMPNPSSIHQVGGHHVRPHPIQTAGFGGGFSGHSAQSPYSASFSRTGSPFDGLMSPLGHDDQDVDLESLPPHQQQYQHQQAMHPLSAGLVGSHQSTHSILGSALQDLNKPQQQQHHMNNNNNNQTSYGSYQSNQGGSFHQMNHQGSSPPSTTTSYPISMPSHSQHQLPNSPLSSLPLTSGNSNEATLSNSYSNSFSPMDMHMNQRMYSQHQQQQVAGSWNDGTMYNGGASFKLPNNGNNKNGDVSDVLHFMQQQQQQQPQQ